MSSENKVEYVQLGKSGLRISVPIIGAMSFGSKKSAPWVIEEAEALEVMKAAWDRGINTIDTAYAYSNGESEKIVAKFLEKYSIPRERYIIMTKCFFLATEDKLETQAWRDFALNDTKDYVNQSGLSRQAIFNQVNASLARLKTDYIDLLQIHRFDFNTPVEETMKALHDVIQSEATMNYITEKNGWTKFVSMQNEYSLQYREEEREMLSYCKFNGIGVIPWGPLNAGKLARPYSESTTRSDWSKGSILEQKWPEPDKTINNRVQEIAKKKGWSMAQVALTWARGKVTSPIVGMSSAKRVDESIVPKGKFELTDEDLKYLEEPYVPVPVRGHA